ncbi:hypothetical protein SCHPADRAFT_856547 [Schizopora paradoxa]|uniref:F-box domain-containing protein n=1 Tax=Schizopora paradoxa TaxID=27342 RepID=A0A0H2RF64_9AGAM|nr:hypothetical protein SCHPADRAFT_856547 [Schizopora paradoxa]
MSQEEIFKRGVKYFRDDKLDDALKMLDKALLSGNEDKRMLDTRAAILEKMGILSEALKSCKKVIDIAPSSWQGYARAARIFLKLKKPDSSLKMVDLALERMPTDPNGQTRRAEMEQTRSDAQKLARKLHKRSYFDFLPVEILHTIFNSLASLSTYEAIRQGAVCRRWRDILCGMPSLWNALVLKPKTPQKKIEVWMQRSRGALKSLSVREGFAFGARPQIHRYFPIGMWERLEELDIGCYEHMESLEEVLPQGAMSRLQLGKLSIRNEDGRLTQRMLSESRAFWGLVEHSCSGNLQSLVFHGDGQATLPLHYVGACTALRELDIASNGIRPTKMFQILSQNPLLETLALWEFHPAPIPPTEEPSEVELNHLKVCKFDALNSDVHLYLSRIRAPNLTSLSFDKIHRNHRFMSSLAQLSFPQLEEFKLTFSKMDSTTKILSFLKNSPLLRRLTYTACFPADVNEFVDGLSSPSPSDLVCPLLEDLDLSANPFLRGHTIMRLTKSRLKKNGEGDETCSLMRLDVTACESLEPSTLPWLRSRIKKVVSRVVKEKSRPSYGGGSYTFV